MCGRFSQDVTWREIAEIYNLIREAQPFDPKVRYNGAPGQQFGVCRVDGDGNRSFSSLRWGLVPSWARDPRQGSRLINARAETVHEKPSFRSAFRARRCLVPVNGWFEWQKRGDGKQPWYLFPADGAPMSFAGLWERWRDGNQTIESFTIITTQAGANIEDLHHRQPAIIAPPRFDDWLDPSTPIPDLLELVRVPFPGSFERRAVTTRVNNVRNDDPGIFEPLAKTIELF